MTLTGNSKFCQLHHMFQTCPWNAAHQLRIGALEMSYVRGTHGVSGWDGESNESLFEFWNGCE